jgi:hypothetical protein
VLQFSFAFIGYFAYRLFLPDQPAKLGGSWLSLITGHLGGFFLWASIFLTAYQGALHGTAYLFWTISFIPIVWALWQTMRQGLASLMDHGAILPEGTRS